MRTWLSGALSSLVIFKSWGVKIAVRQRLMLITTNRMSGCKSMATPAASHRLHHYGEDMFPVGSTSRA
jgi:hypothetical protein